MSVGDSSCVEPFVLSQVLTLVNLARLFSKQPLKEMTVIKPHHTDENTEVHKARAASLAHTHRAGKLSKCEWAPFPSRGNVCLCLSSGCYD